jgi:hypothetical protein
MKYTAEFDRGKYDCAGEDQQEFLNDRPVLSSERAPHMNKPTTV